MKSFARWGLLVLIFGICLVFFGSVICPPIGERDAETEDSEVQYPLQEDAGTYKALPGELQIEDRFPATPTPPALPADSFSTIEVILVDDRDNPVGGAKVRFLAKLKNGPAVRASGQTDASGRLTSPALFREVYEIEASADLFFPVISETISIPSETQSTVQLRLAPASRITGSVMTVHGKAVVHGSLSMTDLNTGVEIRAEIGTGGRFVSPPLDAGNWSLSWKESPTAPSEPKLSYALPLETRQERAFRIVVAAPGADPKHPVGIVEVLN